MTGSTSKSSNSKSSTSSDSTKSQDDDHHRSSFDRVRMLVLETDEVHPETEDRKGSFGDIFNDLFRKAGDKHDPPLTVEVDMRFVVEPKGGKVPKFDDFEGVHAVILTGSMFDAHGEDEWIMKLMELLKELWTKRPDILFSGVCFGHQLLCRMLGSTVEPVDSGEWELAHTPVTLSSVGEKLFNGDAKDGKIHLHQMHQDHVVEPPSYNSSKGLVEEGTKVHVWGSSEHTKVQGVYIRDRLFTSQGHLGFDEKMVKRQMEMRVKSGGIEDKEHAKDAADTAGWKHDGEVVAQAMLRFFHGEDHDVD